MRSQAYQGRLNRVMDFVRENLHEPLTVERLAEVACFSPYHFHRVFSATMGETVGAFVRRARLERATQLMTASPERRLGSIAVEAGFASFSDFSRAFRRHFAIAPSRWDRRSRLESGCAGATDRGEGSNLLRTWIDDDDGGAPAAELTQLPGLTLAYVRIVNPTADNALARGYDQLLAWLRRRGFALPVEPWDCSSNASPTGCMLLGMSWDDDERTPPDLMRYDFACPVPAGTSGSDAVTIRTMPPLLCVSARATGGISRVARVWHYLYGEWLPRSRWEPYQLPAFERFHRRPGTAGWDEWDLECCVPLAPLRADR